ncbi:MAG: PHP domain-containing protein [Actinomycetota bacterium]|nr:PHP domain-containing protein [Actinomycetota bacterium]
MAIVHEAPVFDLQAHSTRSDGTLEPAEVVAAAARAGVRLLALTDHDTVDGVSGALTAGERLGVAVVPAIELSALDEGHEDFHILGYGLDHTDGLLAERLAAYRADRAARVERMADALEELGFALDREELEARRQAGLSVGRPHLAAAALRANSAELQRRALWEVSAFVEAYLVPGRPAYRRRHTPTVPEAIETIHDAGGVAVWAHPFWDLGDNRTVLTTLARFVAAGLDGVEAFYPTHTRVQTRLLASAAALRSLLCTGSADFHGPGHRIFSRFRAFQVYDCVPNLGPIDVLAPASGRS